MIRHDPKSETSMARMDRTLILPRGAANRITAAAHELPGHARRQFHKDVRDLLRGQVSASTADVSQVIGMAKDLARRRGAV